jgi:hypothetical protein
MISTFSLRTPHLCFFRPHSHEDSLVSGTYYVRIPETAGKIFFEDARGPHPPFNNRLAFVSWWIPSDFLLSLSLHRIKSTDAFLFFRIAVFLQLWHLARGR